MRGSSATTAPLLAFHGQFGDRLQVQVDGELQVLARHGLFDADAICRTCPRLSTTTCRWPSTPIRVSLYCFSMPNLPTMSPCSYLANSGRSSSCSLISPVYPITCATMPFCGYSRRCAWISTISGKRSRCDSTNARSPADSSSLIMIGSYLGRSGSAGDAPVDRRNPGETSAMAAGARSSDFRATGSG